MSQYPKMLYRAPGEHLLHGVQVDYRIVDDAAALEHATAAGWCLTPAAAGKAVAVTSADLDGAPPSRAELEEKASELGLRFDGRFSDKRLAAMISDALRATP